MLISLTSLHSLNRPRSISCLRFFPRAVQLSDDTRCPNFLHLLQQNLWKDKIELGGFSLIYSPRCRRRPISYNEKENVNIIYFFRPCVSPVPLDLLLQHCLTPLLYQHYSQLLFHSPFLHLFRRPHHH